MRVCACVRAYMHARVCVCVKVADLIRQYSNELFAVV